ncbi:hypothetical protein QUB63_09340 [Microcoleus sp. ARI1-B5]|uniref:hypothetical protein n=1 Tax=unclassified Microcoleus TaxID=2642155 RepID=UPI002FD5087B
MLKNFSTLFVCIEEGSSATDVSHWSLVIGHQSSVISHQSSGKIRFEWRANLLIKLTFLNLVSLKIVAWVTKNIGINLIDDEECVPE